MTATLTKTYDDRIAARRAHLAKVRAERKDALDLPRSMTQREADAYVTATATLDKQIADFESKVAALAALPNPADDTAWLGHLNTWRQSLCDELMTFKSPVRGEAKQRADAVGWSIKLIDRGFGVATLPIVDLSSTRIGQLMHDAGYETQGEALRGPRGWRGGIKEVEGRIKAIGKERAIAQAALDVLLMDDAERAKADAESQAHSDALRTMDLKANATGTGLVASTLDGDPLATADMTPTQRKAFERFEAAAYPKEAVVETEDAETEAATATS